MQRKPYKPLYPLLEGKKQAEQILKNFDKSILNQIFSIFKDHDPTAPQNKYFEMFAKIFKMYHEEYIKGRHIKDVVIGFSNTFAAYNVLGSLYSIEKHNTKIDYNKKFKNIDDFFKYIEGLSNKAVGNFETKTLGKKGKDYYEIITDTDWWKFVIPLNLKTSVKIARELGKCEGKWCVAYPNDPSFWNGYVLYDYITSNKVRRLLNRRNIPINEYPKKSVVFVYCIRGNASKVALPFEIDTGNIYKPEIRDAQNNLLTISNLPNEFGGGDEKKGKDILNTITSFMKKNIKELHGLVIKNINEEYKVDILKEIKELENADDDIGMALMKFLKDFIPGHVGGYNNGELGHIKNGKIVIPTRGFEKGSDIEYYLPDGLWELISKEDIYDAFYYDNWINRDEREIVSYGQDWIKDKKAKKYVEDEYPGFFDVDTNNREELEEWLDNLENDLGELNRVFNRADETAYFDEASRIMLDMALNSLKKAFEVDYKDWSTITLKFPLQEVYDYLLPQIENAVENTNADDVEEVIEDEMSYFSFSEFLKDEYSDMYYFDDRKFDYIGADGTDKSHSNLNYIEDHILNYGIDG